MIFGDGTIRDERAGEWHRTGFGCAVGWYSDGRPGVLHERFSFGPLSAQGETDIEKLRDVVQIDIDEMRQELLRLEDWMEDTKAVVSPREKRT